MFDGLDPVVQPLYVSPTEYVSRWADRLRPAIERMARGSGGRYEASDIVSALAMGRFQLWIALDGPEVACTLVTEIIEYPRVRAMRCVAIVGSRPRRWLHLLESVETAARDCFGCQIFEALVPPGLERLLRTGGWSLFHSLWHKALA